MKAGADGCVLEAGKTGLELARWVGAAGIESGRRLTACWKLKRQAGAGEVYGSGRE
jgi:hypothetical protein